MRWLVAIVLAVTAGTARADDPDTALGPFQDDDATPATLEMHETTDPCGELSVLKVYDFEKLACARAASLKVGGRLAEIYRGTSTSGDDTEGVGAILVIHDGKKLLASPVIAARHYTKLGAESTIESAQPVLRAIAGAAVLELKTANVWHERRTTPATPTAWQGHAFLACAVAKGAGTCSFVKLGSYMDRCTATLGTKASIHYACTGVDGKRSEGDIALALPNM